LLCTRTPTKETSDLWTTLLAWHEASLGPSAFRALAVAEVPGELWIGVETTTDLNQPPIRAVNEAEGTPAAVETVIIVIAWPARNAGTDTVTD
jgi:hypothetical protein